MENGSFQVLKAELRGVENRVDSIHTGLGSVRSKTADNDVAIQVIRSELKNVSDDIQELKGQMKWVLRGLFAAIAVGLMFTMAVATLVVQAAS